MHAKLLQLCLTLFDPMDCNSLGFSVHGVSRARISEWVAVISSREYSWPWDRTSNFLHLLHWQVGSLPLVPPGKPQIIIMMVIQSCPTLCNPIGYSLPGSSVHGILLARIVEWVAISFSRGYSWSRGQTQVSCIVGRFFTVWATRVIGV